MPKWVFAGFPNVSVMLEYLTLVPPRTQIVSDDGLPKGAGPPFPVTNTVPVTTKPSVVGGLNVGQLLVSVETTPSVISM